MENISVIFWDFDGVLMDSNSIRDLGFETVLSEFPKSQVNQLLEFHKANGGLSRYVKFRYFFEEIRGEKISDDDINKWAIRFSEIGLKFLLNPGLLIDDTIDFVRKNQGRYKMHITSGSDQNELRFICQELEIAQFFESIHGSPKPKKEWVSELIELHGYNKEECVLVGDSINDWEAAQYNGIAFKGVYNDEVRMLSDITLF
jgi:phosphoglycolate phosphatase-like HAD superfamily hydrolase